MLFTQILAVVADTTKVRIFKQITTSWCRRIIFTLLLLIPQRYEFSSKSQHSTRDILFQSCCCWYHKGTNFQANHNCDATLLLLYVLLLIPQRYEFSSKSQLYHGGRHDKVCCCWYHKGTNFQANHNGAFGSTLSTVVVADTTKVRIFKQITTKFNSTSLSRKLLLIPQRYEFSSKSQQEAEVNDQLAVVADTTKVRIFKQITTRILLQILGNRLLLIPQRYEFSSKSQPNEKCNLYSVGCCWYHKGTNFQANHNHSTR